MGIRLHTMVVEEAGPETSILVKDPPCMVTLLTNHLISRTRVIRLATLRISLTLRMAIQAALIVAAVATLITVLIADRQDLVLTRHSGKVEGVAVPRQRSSLICHGPQRPGPEVAGLPQRHLAPILRLHLRQPKPRRLMPTTTPSVRQKTYEWKTRGRRKKRCHPQQSLLLRLPHSRNLDSASH